MFAYKRTAVAKDSEMCRKIARVSLSSTPKDQKEESNGSVSHGKCAFASVMPVMRMPESEPMLVGIAENQAKPNRTPARLKPTEEPAPLPRAVPTADRFSWDGMGLDPNAESEEPRTRRAAQIQKEGAAAAILWKKRGQDKAWTEVKRSTRIQARSLLQIRAEKILC